MRAARLGAEHFKAWNDLVRANPASGFMQSWEWADFKEASGVKVERLGLFEGEDLAGGAMVYSVDSTLGASPLALPHGPVLPWEEPARAEAGFRVLKEKLAELAGGSGSPLARFEPFLEELPGWFGRLPRAPVDLVPTPTLLVPVMPSEEEQLANMTQKGRYNARLAQRKGVAVASAPDNSLTADFHELFELTCCRHNFAGEPLGFFTGLMAALGPAGMARTYLATYQGMPAAAAVAAFFGGRATYLYGGTSPFLTRTMAAYAMHAAILGDARARGCHTYDMYGVAPEDQPLHAYAKFSAFKARFGGRLFRPAGAHDLYFYPQLAKSFASRLEGALK